MLSPVICVVLLLTCFFAFTNGNFFKDLFNPGLDKSPLFSNSQLYLLEGSDSVGIDGINGYIGCFGDFNSDKYTDLFIVVGNQSETRVDVYLWDMKHWEFTNSSASVVSPYITNIAAGDFNYDGKLDLMVSGLNKTENTTYIKIFLGDHSTLAAEPETTINDAASMVTIVDVDNDLHLDIFGEISQPNTTTLKRVFWINKGEGRFDRIDDPHGTAPLVSPHSSAFVDIDGDCLADRFVVSQDADGNPQYEILLNQKSKGYNPLTPVKMPKGSGQVTFADFDKDGNMDFIIPVCYPQPNCSEVNSIKIIFNKQKPMCSLLTRSASCRSSTALCTADANFHLGEIDASPADPYFQDVNLTNELGDHFYFDNEKGRPLALRVGDYNLDGYPPLFISLFQNRDCLTLNYGRTFLLQMVGGRLKKSLQMLMHSLPYLMHEDGVVDMLVLADNPPRIETIYNNFENDAFFLKALGLNGVCPEWCPTSPKFPSPKPYGVNYVGAVFKYTYTDLSGKIQLATGTQLPQSAYLALNTPYILFGLGRTSNYIEQFYYGVPLNQSVHYNYWTGSTIPNSQVVAVPYKPDSPAGWTLELYITPSGLLFWIMVALVVSVIVLAIIVYVFYRKEKKEDELKKQEQAHLFSFDAL